MSEEMKEQLKIIEENIDYNSLIFGNGDAELSEKLINAINCLVQACKEDESDLTSVYLKRSI